MLRRVQALHPAIICAVNLRREMVNQAAILVMDWTEVQLIPENRSIFSIVDKFDVDLTLLLQSCSDLGDRRWGGRGTLKKPAVASEDLICLVAREVRNARFASTIGWPF